MWFFVITVCKCLLCNVYLQRVHTFTRMGIKHFLVWTIMFNLRVHFSCLRILGAGHTGIGVVYPSV